MPGNDSPRVEDLMPGSFQTDWECYWDNGNPSDNYFELFDNSNNIFEFKAGRGFWIISKENLGFHNQVQNVLLNDDSQFEIPLHDGWNIISNPFNQSIDWDAVVAANPDNLPPIFRYDGSFKTATKFLPFVGYYLMNDTGRNSLYVPYPMPSAAMPKQSKAFNWKILIRLHTKQVDEQCAYLGVAEDALIGKDGYDFNKPRAIGPQFGVSFYRTNWNETYPEFVSDIRPNSDKKQSWDFQVHGTKGQSATLTFEGISDVPVPLSVYLLDAEHGIARDLKARKDYTFIAAKPETRLQVLVGPKQDIQSDIEAVVPQTFRLESNYPNPFNPQTAIPIAMPKDGDIRLEVFNILGKHIQTLHNGLLTTGRHVFIWNGRNAQGEQVPSGVYFYQVTLNNRSRLTRKMILMK